MTKICNRPQDIILEVDKLTFRLTCKSLTVIRMIADDPKLWQDLK